MPKDPYQVNISILGSNVKLADAVERIKLLPSILWAKEDQLKGRPVITAMATVEATKKGTKREIANEFNRGVVISEVL